MAAFIHLVNDISTPVKLGWAIVLVWSAVQVMWYKRGRLVSSEVEPVSETEPVSGGWAAGRLFAAFRRSSDAAEANPGRSPLSIAPARPLSVDVETAAESGADDNPEETMDTDWFDEALRMSETAREGQTGEPTQPPSRFSFGGSEARQ
jgi:hypothetical protein